MEPIRLAINVAIIGGGAAGIGVLLGLENSGVDVRITLIDQPPAVAPPIAVVDPTADPVQEAHYYQALRHQMGLHFPPQKSYFGMQADRATVRGWGDIWRSSEAGGLTRYWGGSALPLPPEEFDTWPITFSALRTHYEAVATEVGIAGAEDALSELWGHGLCSRPPLSLPPLFKRLRDVLNRPQLKNDVAYELRAGTTPLAIETNKEKENACRSIGTCLAGCPHDAIYSAARSIRKRRAAGRFVREIYGRAEQINPDKRTILVAQRNGSEEVGPYDRIYLTAGCISSAEIILKSGFSKSRTSCAIYDNAVETFPIVYTGSEGKLGPSAQAFSLSNIIIACRPKFSPSNSLCGLMIQAYPASDFLWKYYMPCSLWSSFQPVGRLMRNRLIIGRLYHGGRTSQQYCLRVTTQGKLELELASPAITKRHPVWRDIRMALRGSNFIALTSLRKLQKTSSHYAGAFPLGGGVVDEKSALSNGIYLCDSAAFPQSSAYSPTMTIMAYARWVASRSL